MSSHSLRCSIRGDVVGEGGAGVLPAGPPGGEGAAEHPLAERLGDDRAVGRRSPVALATVAMSSGVGRGVIRSTMVVTIDSRLRRASRPGRGRPARPGRATHPGGDRAVAGQVVAGHQGDRSGVGPAAGGEPGDQPGRRRADRRGEVAAQRAMSACTSSPVAVEAAVGAAQVAGLGDVTVTRGQVGEAR